MTRGHKVWFNGRLIAAEDAKVGIFTHGLHYGTGIFEGIRAYKQNKGGGAIFRLREHIQRFTESAKILQLPLKFSVDELCQACIQVTRENKFEETYIRPLAFISEGPLGIYPVMPKQSLNDIPVDIAIMNWQWGSYLGDAIKQGASIKTSTFSRPQVNSVMTKGKICGQYTSSVLAKLEARREGYTEALFLDTEGFVAECTGENIFIIKDGVVKTPPPFAILAGITRATLLEHFRMQNIEALEQKFSRDEMWTADEVFICGTAAEITPVCEIDGRVIGSGKPGPITQKVQKDYFNFVHGDLPPYGRHWLTPL